MAIQFHLNHAKLKTFGVTEITAILSDGTKIKESFWGSNDNEDLRIKQWQYDLIAKHAQS